MREIDDKVKAFLARPIEGDWPYLWIDATYVKVRQNGRVVSVAVIVAVGVNSDGRREILGLDIGPSEAETFWTGFLRKLAPVTSSVPRLTRTGRASPPSHPRCRHCSRWRSLAQRHYRACDRRLATLVEQVSAPVDLLDVAADGVRQRHPIIRG